MGLRSRSAPRAYRLHRRIATGGMGEVYEGTADELHRPVAVKRVLDADTTDENLRLLFLREVAVAATLEHHHVVEVIDAGSQGLELYLVMEYVDGPSLAEVLDALYRQGRLLPVDLACGIVSQVAVGLAHAHERSLPDGTPLGIIHRDVAVENVLIGSGGVPKLVDFGLAKLTGHSLTEPGVVRGRPRTLSPEQARGDKVTARSDIFSLGAVLFELVSGEQLYPNESTASLLFKVAAGDYVPVHQRVPSGTDPDLVRIIERSVAVDPQRRYGSARQMVRELDAFRAARGLRMSSRALARLVAELMPAIEDRRGTPHPGELEGTQIVLSADPEGLSVEAPAPDANLRDEVDLDALQAQRDRAATSSRPRIPSEAPTELHPWGMTTDLRRQPELRERVAAGASAGRLRQEPPDGGRRPSGASTASSLADELQAPVGVLDSSLPRPRSPARLSEDERAARGWLLYALAVGLAAVVGGVWVYLA